jgi:hypothetical protein
MRFELFLTFLLIGGKALSRFCSSAWACQLDAGASILLRGWANAAGGVKPDFLVKPDLLFVEK